MTLFNSLPYFDMAPTIVIVCSVPFSSPPTVTYSMGCVALATIAGIFTVFGSGYCDSFADRVHVDFICGCPAF